jgi:hypothetical protein
MEKKSPAKCAGCYMLLVSEPAGACNNCAGDVKGGFLCAACFQHHKDKVGRFETHSALRYESAETILLDKVGLRSSLAMCSTSGHNNKPAELFCCEPGCVGHTLLCGTCVATSHQGHRLESMENAAINKRAGLLRAAHAPAGGIVAPSLSSCDELSVGSVRDAVENIPAVAAVRQYSLSIASKNDALPGHAAAAQQALDGALDSLIGCSRLVHSKLSAQLQQASTEEAAAVLAQLMTSDGVLLAARSAAHDALQVRGVLLI